MSSFYLKLFWIFVVYCMGNYKCYVSYCLMTLGIMWETSVLSFTCYPFNSVFPSSPNKFSQSINWSHLRVDQVLVKPVSSTSCCFSKKESVWSRQCFILNSIPLHCCTSTFIVFHNNSSRPPGVNWAALSSFLESCHVIHFVTWLCWIFNSGWSVILRSVISRKHTTALDSSNRFCGSFDYSLLKTTSNYINPQKEVQ